MQLRPRAAVYRPPSTPRHQLLGIGYFVWALIVYGRGQTPAKQLLGRRYVPLATARRGGWGRTFLREMCKGFVRAIAAMTPIRLAAKARSLLAR